MDFSPLIKDGAIRVTEANRKALKKWVVDTYLNPKKQAFQSGNLSSTAARIGIPELYVGDKQVFLTSVGKFLGDKITNVGFRSLGLATLVRRWQDQQLGHSSRSRARHRQMASGRC